METTTSSLAGLFGGNGAVSIASVSVPYHLAVAQSQALASVANLIIADRLAKWLKAREAAQVQPGGNIVEEAEAAKELERVTSDFSGNKADSLPVYLNGGIQTDPATGLLTGGLYTWYNQYGTRAVGTPGIPAPPAVPANLLAYLTELGS